MQGSQNAIIGDNMGIDIPSTMVDNTLLNQEQSMAKYSQSKEFKQLKEHLEERIAYYQQYLPNGKAIAGADLKEAQDMWIPANVIIGEFRLVLAAYENANQVVKENATRP